MEDQARLVPGAGSKPGTHIKVFLYKDQAPRELWKIKIKGYSQSATDDSLTLVLKDGQTRTLPKSSVRKVLTRRPFWKRHQGWVTAVVFSVLMGVLMHDPSSGAEPGQVPMFLSLEIGGPTLIAFLVAPKGAIYSVPPKHRTRPQKDKPSGSKSNAPGKQKNP